MANPPRSMEALAHRSPLIILDAVADMHGGVHAQPQGYGEAYGAVIFISAKYTEPADRSEAMLAGGGFFSKPVEIDELWTEINICLTRKSKSYSIK